MIHTELIDMIEEHDWPIGSTLLIIADTTHHAFAIQSTVTIIEYDFDQNDEHKLFWKCVGDDGELAWVSKKDAVLETKNCN